MNPPSLPTVANRLLALTPYVSIAAGLPSPSALTVTLSRAAPLQRKEFRAGLDAGPAEVRAQMETAGVWSSLTPSEQKYVLTPPHRATDTAWAAAVVELESVAVLQWSLRIAADLPSFDTPTLPSILLAVQEKASSQLTLRPPGEIERAHTLLELWHWRARTHLFATGVFARPDGVTQEDLDRSVKDATTRAYAESLIADRVDDDFAIGGRAVRDLSPEEGRTLAVIAQTRHRAASWLTGRAPNNDWDRAPTHT